MSTCEIERANARTFEERMTYVRKLISPYVNAGSRVLDAGCGHHNRLIDRCDVQEMVGVDVDEAAVKRNRNISKGVVADIEELPSKLSASPFDFIMCYDVLEHLRDPKRFVSHVARILRNGGHVFFATPNRRCIAGAVASFLPTRWVKILSRVITGKETPNKTHYYRLNEVCTIAQCLEAEGFRNIRIVLFSPLVGAKWTVRRCAYLPDYLIGKSGFVRDYSLRILCVAERGDDCATRVS